LQLQTYQQQLQVITAQKQQIELQLAEIDAAIDALKDVKDDFVFKAVGPILAKVKKNDTEKELKETKDLLELRTKTMDKQMEKVKDKMKELNDKVSKSLPQAG
jgi:prefoldin beta subunit